MGASAKAWNPDLHAGAGDGRDPGILLQAGRRIQMAPKQVQKQVPPSVNTVAESLKTITYGTTQPSEVRPRELFDQLYKRV